MSTTYNHSAEASRLEHFGERLEHDQGCARNRERSITARLAGKALCKKLDYDWSDAELAPNEDPKKRSASASISR
jgi:hypothetical protein